MNIITIRTQIRKVAARWRDAYSGGYYAHDPNKQAISKTLDAIDPESATADEVAAIIGNTSWACEPKCHECQETVSMVVQIGEPIDYESHTADICLPCLKKAVKLASSKAHP